MSSGSNPMHAAACSLQESEAAILAGGKLDNDAQRRVEKKVAGNLGFIAAARCAA